VSGPESRITPHLKPYDLEAAAAVLFGPAHDRSSSEKVLWLGSETETHRPEVVVREWGKCRPGCPVKSPMANHEAGAVVTIRVPCDSLPHCHACECGTGHDVTLTADQVVNLKLTLP
jgi:hypothetical protein